MKKKKRGNAEVRFIDLKTFIEEFAGRSVQVPTYLPPGGLSAAPYGTLRGRPVIAVCDGDPLP